MGAQTAPTTHLAPHLHFLQPLEAPRQGREAGLHHGVFHLGEDGVTRNPSLEACSTHHNGDLWASPHLLLEAPVVHLVHAAAGEGLQVLPALAAEEPHVAQVRHEVAQAFLEISRVLQGQNGENAAGLGPAASIPVTPVKLTHPHAVNRSSGQRQPSPWGFLDARPGHRIYRAAAPPTAPRRSCTPWKAKGRGQRDPN